MKEKEKREMSAPTLEVLWAALNVQKNGFESLRKSLEDYYKNQIPNQKRKGEWRWVKRNWTMGMATMKLIQ